MVCVSVDWIPVARKQYLTAFASSIFVAGPDRHSLLSKLEEIDVLLASYNTLAYDFKPNKKQGDSEPELKKMKSTGIFDAKFHRIILDEAHTIRNMKTRAFKAINLLKAERRICLTGTPLQNGPDDILALFNFLGVQPLGDRDIFRRSITQPIKSGDQDGLARLRVTMSHFALRRTKAAANLNIPDKVVELRTVTFPENDHHNRIHQTLFQSARGALQITLSNGDGEAFKVYSTVLEAITRIRQACCSGVLIPKDRLERAEKVMNELNNVDTKALTAEEGKKLLEKLKGSFEENRECAICLEDLEETAAVIIRSCNHVFCESCISHVADGNCRCPLCRQDFKPSDMIKAAVASDAAKLDGSEQPQRASEALDSLGPSPKINALLAALGEMKDDEKGVIFSQFTKFLDEIGRYVKENGYDFVRIDGSMNAKRRIESMRGFSQEGGPRLILCSLKAAGTGINLTRANHIYMMDTWWNQAVESQAIDRVHRIGQTRAVRALRFVIGKSIEERMVEIQEAKAAVGKGAMEKLSAEEARKARITDLRTLFQIPAESDDDKK